MLPRQAEKWEWPTPISKDADGMQHQKRKGHQYPNLTGAVREWPTPGEDNANNSGGASRSQGMKTGKGYYDLTVAAREASLRFHQEETIPGGHGSSRSDQTSRPPPKKLNPLFTAWLMGMPEGWINFAPLATGAFRSWLDTHSRILRGLLYWSEKV